MEVRFEGGLASDIYEVFANLLLIVLEVDARALVGAPERSLPNSRLSLRARVEELVWGLNPQLESLKWIIEMNQGLLIRL